MVPFSHLQERGLKQNVARIMEVNFEETKKEKTRGNQEVQG
jgi:hypothetical protein